MMKYRLLVVLLGLVAFLAHGGEKAQSEKKVEIAFKLTCDAGTCADKARQLAEMANSRAAIVGAGEVEVVRHGPRRVVLRVADRPGLKNLLSRYGRTALHRVDDTKESWTPLQTVPAGVRYVTWEDSLGTRYALESEDQVALRSALGGRLPEARITGWSFELGKEGEGFTMSAILLHEEPVLTSSALANVTVSVPVDGGMPSLSLELTRAGASALQNATANMVGKRLAVVIDGEVVHAPKVREAITGGRVTVTKCAWRQNMKAPEMARAYAAILRSPYPAGVEVE